MLLRTLAARALLTPIARKMERTAFEPRRAQERALARILGECAGSELGRRFGLDRVRTLADLARLPTTDYESLRDASDRVFRDGARGAFRRCGRCGRICARFFSEARRSPPPRASG